MSRHNQLQMEYLNPRELKDPVRQLRKPTDQQIPKTKRIIDEGGILPIIIDTNNYIIAGWHMAEAARQMKIESVPVIRFDHLTKDQVRTLRIAYDRVAEEAEWDKEVLAAEFLELQILVPDLTITGFELDEINLVLDILPDTDPNDIAPAVAEGSAITQLGDLYIMGDHKLLCADSLEEDSYKSLLGDEVVQMCFVDMPYNVKIDGHVGNSGDTKHREFAMASGEMSEDEFARFLETAHENIAAHLQGGGITFSCMDWRHMGEMLGAGAHAKMHLINMCVWAKDNGGMGSLYRSQHELVFVFKKGKAKHINNVSLGSNGRYRTNIWQYPGVNSFGGGRMDELKLHPTVKPTAMVADAIKDCSKRSGIILDPFGGSGTTLIAAENTGRKARLIELDPHYCDVTIRRWQELTGLNSVHAETGKTFNETLTDGEK
ncbi:MAG: DNA methylase N-4 [Zetaproteobacteria bacterium]|nr:MAG: DNA methylase N-4 [Zetaproteobacteria bacterium]